MNIRHRPMLAADVRECVAIVASDPVLARRYGSAIGDLRESWVRLLGRQAFRSVVFAEGDRSNAVIVGGGVSAFVRDDFLIRIKTQPFFWVGPELLKLAACGASPLLTDRQVQQANKDGRLRVVTWESALCAGHRDRPESNGAVFRAFVEEHCGFFLDELIGQARGLLQLQGMLRSGGMLLGWNGEYRDRVDEPLFELLAKPHYVGLTRDLARERFGTWIGSLFDFQPPRIGLRPGEQRLLLWALHGGTDEQLAGDLMLSVSAVKKSWQSIYDRVARRLPGLLFDCSLAHKVSERGKEKKQRLLAYIREHPEELRPASPQRQFGGRSSERSAIARVRTTDPA